MSILNLHDTKVSPTLDELAYRLKRAKDKENDARLQRLEIEDQIIEVMGVKEEGSLTLRGDQFSLTTTGRMTRSIDAEKLASVRHEIPQPLFDRLFSYTPKLNARELKYIENNEPQYYQIVAQAITAKPGKAGVSFKELED